MKKTIVIALALVMTICCNAQSKKELAESVKALTERCANLESQVANWQSLLMTMQKTQLDQAMEIKALQDSLAAVKKGVKAAAPKVRTFEDILDGFNYTEKEKEVLRVLNSFYRANSWEEKDEYVFHLDDLLKELKKKYPKGTGATFFSAGYAFVGLDNATEGKVVEAIKDGVHYYLVKTNEGYKIDYEASFNPREHDYYYYVEKGITTPFDFREYNVRSYNNWDSGLGRAMKSIIGSNYAPFIAGNEILLVSKNDPIYRTLKANEEDDSHRYILNIAYDPKLKVAAYDKSRAFFIIKKIVKNGTWSYYDKDK